MTAAIRQIIALNNIHSRPANVYFEFALGVGAMGAAILWGVDLMPAIGLGLFAYSLIWFVNATGVEITIAPTVSMIAAAQWVVGPYFAYYHEAVTAKYRMYVPEDRYFDFVVPSLFAMIFFLRYFSPAIHINRLREIVLQQSNLTAQSIYVLFSVGIFSEFLSGYVPNSLNFAVFLMTQFTFIASIYMIVLRMRYRWLCLAMAFLVLILNSIENSLFHALLLWSTLIASYICAEFRLRFLTKILVFFGFILLSVQLQASKAEYRLRIFQNPENANISTLIDTMYENYLFETSQFSSTNDTLGMLNARLNQGWIISAIMNYMPAVQEHEEGATFISALEESILPRFLVEKRAVEVSASFKKYTGLSVSNNTSFGISVLGESWVNFGSYGIIFMGFFGAFYGLVTRLVVVLGKNFPTVIFWLPLIFLQAVKAETELVVVLNHISKSTIFIILIYIVAHKVLKWRI